MSKSHLLAIRRFWKYTNKNGPIHPVCGQCWEWQSTLQNGYGRFLVVDRLVLAHRFSWMLHFGKIPSGLLICHKCDNPKCVNPTHLFLGTYADNAQDMIAKGRGVAWGGKTGESHHLAKLTEDQVLSIRKEYRFGSAECGYPALANKYGVDVRTIYQVVRRISWKHI